MVAGKSSAPLNNLDLAIVVSIIAMPSRQNKSLKTKAKKPINRAETVKVVAMPIGTKPFIRIIK